MSKDKIRIIKGDITTYKKDAIVNAANMHLYPGGGVCGAIFEKAGFDELYAACKKCGPQEVGSATITAGFKLDAKYIIHAVGPRYAYDENPEKLLEDTYRNSLMLAINNNIKSIAFPSISTGIYCFPLEKACQIALKTMMKYSDKFDEIAAYCFDDYTYNVYLKYYNDL